MGQPSWAQQNCATRSFLQRWVSPEPFPPQPRNHTCVSSGSTLLCVLQLPREQVRPAGIPDTSKPGGGAVPRDNCQLRCPPL